MDIDDPFDNAQPISQPTLNLLNPSTSGPSDPTTPTSGNGTGKENEATKGEKEKPPGDQQEQRQQQDTTPPDVDKLLASLEATVRGNPLQDVSNLDNSTTNPTVPPPAPSSAPNKKRKPRAARKPKVKQTEQGSQRTDGTVAAAFRTDHHSSEPTSQGFQDPPPSSSSKEGKARSEKGSGKGKTSAPKTLNQTWTTSSTSYRSPSSSSSSVAGSAGTLQGRTTSYDPSTSLYARKPNNRAADDCKDVTSFKFVPNNDEKVDIVLQVIHGERSERPVSPYTGSTKYHNLPTVFSAVETGIPVEDGPGARSEWDLEHFLPVVDFSAEVVPRSQVIHSIPRRKSIPFILLFREARSRKRWAVPDAETAADFINDHICMMFGQDAPYAESYERTGKWGKITTLLLKPDPLGATSSMEDFRSHLARWSSRGMDFDTFPKDVVTMKSDISIILRSNMKCFMIEVLPKVLFMRNKHLIAGSLRVLATKFFPAGKMSQRGESKEHWRQIELKGDEQVMRCLRFIPESTPFLLGVEPVQLRGGLRPHEPEILGKRARTGTDSFTTVTGPPNKILDTGNSSDRQELSFPSPTTRGVPSRGRRERGARRGRGRRP